MFVRNGRWGETIFLFGGSKLAFASLVYDDIKQSCF